MNSRKRPPALGAVVFFTIVFTLGTYFAFASVQGDYGLFRRIQVEAETEVLCLEKERLLAEVTILRNKTRRLSDEYLDLDLLDQQARDVLGLVRGDEVVIR